MRPIKINPKMRGVFTKKAKRKKMSVQKYANYVIKKYKGKKKTKKQLKLLRQAVFAKTAKKWKKRKKTRKKRGGSRTFTSVKEFFKYLDDNKAKRGKGNEKHGQYILHKKLININTKNPRNANFKFQFLGFKIRRDLGYQQYNVNLTREILRHVLVFKLLETNIRDWQKHIDKDFMFPISQFLTSHRWPNENLMSQPIKIKGVKDDKWWTLNFRDNHEIVSLNENMPRRNNTMMEEELSERGPLSLGLAGQEMMPGRSQGNDEQQQEAEQQQGGRRKKTRKKRGGAYSPMAKKLLRHKTNEEYKKLKKIEPQVRKLQQTYRDYRERKKEWEEIRNAYNRSADDLLAPPKKDYNKMTYQEMMDDDY